MPYRRSMNGIRFAYSGGQYKAGTRYIGGRRAGTRTMMAPFWTRGLVKRGSVKKMVERTYKFKRTVVIEGLLQSGSAALPGGCVVGLSFSLGQINFNRSIQGGAVTSTNVAVPGVAEMTSLFQQYKVTKAVIKIVPSRPDGDLATGIPVSPLIAGFPTLLSVTDYDDNDATTTVAPLQECGDCRITMLDGIKTYTVKPKFVGVVTGAPGTTVAGPPTTGFLDCAQANIEHNGVKFGLIAQANYAASAYIDVYYTMRGSK